jgi:hypothetical protein
VQEGDTFPPGTESGRLVDEPETGVAAAVEGGVKVVDFEADVVNARSALGYELRDGRIRRRGLEQLDKGVAGGEASNAGAIGIIQRHGGHAEDVTVKGQELVEAVHGDADMRDARTTGGRFLQEILGRETTVREW